MNFDSSFAHDYEVEIIHDFFGSLGKLQHVCYPGEGRMGQDLLDVHILPDIHMPWLGTFALGERMPNAINGMFSCPDPRTLCVVASGEGYLVRTDAPQIWEEIPATPVLDARPIQANGLLIFADFVQIVAYGPNGLAWVTPRLSWDGLKINEITPDTIYGTGWDAPIDAEVQFTVDLATGRCSGGARPLSDSG